jgi:hypothetical protein
MYVVHIKRWKYIKAILILVFIAVCKVSVAQKMIQDSTGSGNIKKDINHEQDNPIKTNDKVYIGISSEISLCIGVTSVGFRINIDAGYKISKVFGIEGLLFGGAYNIKTYDGTGPYRQNILIEKETWNFRGLLAGPLFSIAPGEKTNWNISPMIGYAWFYPEYYYDSPYSSVAFDLNTNLFFHTGSRMAFRVSADCFINDEILTINFGLGLIYKFNK